jgi:quercetin dioxygenase-like cupin family protein
MPLLDFDALEAKVVAAHYSDARGPVFRGQTVEAARVRYPRGQGARPHQHPEEQVMYLLAGRLRVEMDGETFEVKAGQAFHAPPNAVHAVHALEDVEGLSFKALHP